VRIGRYRRDDLPGHEPTVGYVFIMKDAELCCELVYGRRGGQQVEIERGNVHVVRSFRFVLVLLVRIELQVVLRFRPAICVIQATVGFGIGSGVFMANPPLGFCQP
jgi:hypothetical protein